MKTEENKKAKRHLVLTDLDGTLLNGYSQKILLSVLRKAGILTAYDQLRIALWFLLFRIGVNSTIESGMALVYRKLEGIEVKIIDSLINNYFSSFRNHLYPGAIRLINDHLSSGARIVMVSSSVEPVVKRVCSELGISEYMCTVLETESGKYTGKIKGLVLTGKSKVNRLKLFLQESNEKFGKIYFYNDHFSELELMSFVDVPVCVNPDPRLRKVAIRNNWEIIHWV